jgi:hypothetical protein
MFEFYDFLNYNNSKKLKMKKTEKNTDNINYLFKKLFSSENTRITCFIIPYLEYKDVYSLKSNEIFYNKREIISRR